MGNDAVEENKSKKGNVIPLLPAAVCQDIDSDEEDL